MNPQRQIDKSKLTVEQLSALEQLEKLDNLAQSMARLAEAVKASKSESDDSRVLDSLASIRTVLEVFLDRAYGVKFDPESEAPEIKQPDYEYKPIVAAVSKLEKALNAQIAKIDVNPEFKPNIQVAAPKVTVPKPEVIVNAEPDLTEIEAILKKDIPKAFRQAVTAIKMPDVPGTDLSPLEKRLDTAIEWLESIDTTSRIKPTFPSTIKVTNPDGTAVSGSGALPTIIVNGSVTVTTAGTRVQFGSNTVKAVTIKADVANTGIIYVGSSTVTSSNGFELLAGDTISFDIANTNVIYIDASADNQMVNFLGVS